MFVLPNTLSQVTSAAFVQARLEAGSARISSINIILELKD
jgi:hypothetical protein